MKLGKITWFTAIVLACVLLTTGCAELTKNHETTSTGSPEAMQAGQSWGRATQSSPSKNKSSFFFNDKSREIEASLGL